MRNFFLFTFFLGIMHFACDAQSPNQNEIDSLRKIFQFSNNPRSRINAGVKLCSGLLTTDPQGSIQTGKQVLHSLDSLQKAGGIADSTADYVHSNIIQSMGIAYNNVGDVEAFLNNLMLELKTASRSNNKLGEISVMEKIGIIYDEQGHSEEAIQYFRKSLALAEETGYTYFIALELGNLGDAFLNSNTDSTLWYYNRSLAVMQKPDMKDRDGAMGWMLQNIGEVFEKNGQLDSALSYYNRSLDIRKSIDHRLGMYRVHQAIAGLLLKQNKLNEALMHANTSIRIAEENGFRQFMYDSYRTRSEILSALGRFKEALEDHKRFVQEKDTIVSERNTKSLVQQTMRYEYSRKLLSDSLEFTKKEAVLTERTQKQRIGLFAAAGALVLLFSLAYSIYKGKKRSDELLLNILPAETAKELKQKGHADAKLIDHVTVMFTDFKNFTRASEQLSPPELVAEIHHCYSEFDNIIVRHNLEKIKTIGDSYMCAGGLPVPNTTNAADTVKAALEICDFMKREKQKREAEGKPFFEIRIGCHTGPVVAGIVGIKKFAYDIWGDTVNIASRMESSGEAGKVNISGATYNLVKDQFHCTYRGKIQAKNKGEIDMFFVNRSPGEG